MLNDLWSVVSNNSGALASGFFITVRLVLLSFVIAMVVGTFVAALRVAPSRPLQWLGGAYVEAFRNIPLLVLLLIFFAGLRRAGIAIGPWVAGTMALGLYTAAYIAEALRSGVFAVGHGQIEASLSLGFTYAQTLRKVVLPQAFRTVIPPIGNLVIAMIKNSAIIGGSILAIPDVLKVARVIQSRNALPAATFIWAAIGYLLLTIPATILVRRLEKRYVVRR